MKKRYTEEESKLRQKKASERELKKRRKKNKRTKRATRANKISIQEKRKGQARRRRKRIKLPTIFSISENTQDCLDFFEKVREYIEGGRKLFFDMESINKLTLDALLYLISIFDYYEIRDIGFDISGNVPQDEDCFNLLIESDFFKRVESRVPISRKKTGNILEIKMGKDIDNRVAKEAIDFSLRHLKQKMSKKSKAMYRTIIELMGNTREHAFTHKYETSKWYLICWNDNLNNKMMFAYLDGGLGIPTTIKKNFKEQAFGILSGSFNDKKLIKSALEGEFRTRTGHKWRGKGLPDIYEKSKEGLIDDLKIISNYGFIDCTGGMEFDMEKIFNGTLYLWSYA